MGAYYQERNILVVNRQNPTSIAITLDTLFNFGNPNGIPGGLDPVTGQSLDADKRSDIDTETYSLFGNVSFQATESLEIAAGIRWTDEKKTSVISAPYVHAALTAGGFVPTGFQTPDIEFDDENFSPELSAVYTLSDEVNLFAAYKTGFKSGGIDTSALLSGSLGDFVAANDFSELIFDSEEVEGFEAGVKSTLLDSRLRLNATAYNYVFEDLQLQQFNPTDVQFTTTNVGEITSRGLEVEIEWLTPVNGLSVFAALAFSDSEYSESFVNQNGVDLKGRETIGNSDWSGNVGFDYYIPISDTDLEFGLSGNVAYRSEYQTGDTDPDIYVQDGFATADVAVSIADQDNQWQVSLITNNVFDEIYTTNMILRPGALPNAGGLSDQMLTQTRGRQIFLKAQWNFD